MGCHVTAINYERIMIVQHDINSPFGLNRGDKASVTMISFFSNQAREQLNHNGVRSMYTSKIYCSVFQTLRQLTYP